MIQENQKGEKKMPKIFVDFRPAEIQNGKETIVYYYVLNPYTGKLVRKRVRCNSVHGKKERMKYARLMCQAINERLFMGWNPFFDEHPHSAVTITAAIDNFLKDKEKNVRERTLISYRSYCCIFKEFLEMRGLSNSHCITIDKYIVGSYLEWLERHKNLSNRSYNNYCMFLYTLFDYFVRKGYSAENHAANIPRKKVDRKKRVTIPKDDRAKIKEWVYANCPNYYYAMQLCYRLLIRPHEIVQLKLGYIDMRENMLKIPSFVAKNHCDRVLGIPDDLMEYFKTLSDLPDSYYLFANRHTYAPGPKMMASTRLAEKWSQMRNALKLPKEYQFYSLKDTGITEMLETGVPAKFVKELADHHSLEMTEKYTHRSDAKKILEWNRLEF